LGKVIGTFNSACAQLRFKGITPAKIQLVNEALPRLIKQLEAMGNCAVITLSPTTDQPVVRRCSTP
jgi:hypothetical protein